MSELPYIVRSMRRGLELPQPPHGAGPPGRELLLQWAVGCNSWADHVRNRPCLNLAEREPLCESIVGALGDRDPIIDGEIVCLGWDGRGLFKNLMYRRGEPYLYTFDLPRLDGEDLREWPLVDRKLVLRKLVPKRGSRLLYVDHVERRGKDLFQLVCREDLEGVVAKWKRGPYMPDDRTSWVKIKKPNYSQIINRDKMFEKRVRA